MSYQIIGCGDIGRRVAARLAPNSSLVGWARSSESVDKATNQGFTCHRLDLDAGDGLPEISPDQLFYFIPPPPQGRSDPRLSSFLSNLTRLPKRIVLISTTGIYGDCNGAWIDETRTPNPHADRAFRRLDAETTLRSWAEANQVEWVILRVPGIYAPDRLPLARLKKKSPLVCREQAPWTNRIHADDLARVCIAVMHADCGGEIINVSDDEPSTMTDYFLKVAEYAGLPAPEQILMQAAQKDMSEGMRSYMQESRRIRNDKMKQLLRIELCYPNLELGLSRSR